MKKLCFLCLKIYLSLKEEWSPRSTKVVRYTVSGLSEVDVYDLPNHFSNIGLYGRLCDGRGWKVNTDGQGTTLPVAKPEVEQQPVCSKSTFEIYWTKRYSNIRIASPSCGICSDCHTYFHRFCTRESRIFNRTFQIAFSPSLVFVCTTLEESI